MAKVIGDIKDNYLLADTIDMSEILEPIMDDVGVKTANVFF